nr:chromodomain Y-like protein [Coffea arabica]
MRLGVPGGRSSDAENDSPDLKESKQQDSPSWAYSKDEMDKGWKQAKRASPVIRKQFQKDVEAVLDHRTMGQSKKNRWTDYLVQWKGETELDATWEPDVTLWQFENKIAEYLRNVLKQAKLTRASTSSGGGGLLAP